MPFTEDFAPLLATEDFATAALWKGSITVNGIFDPNPLDLLNVETRGPMFYTDPATMPGIAAGDTLAISGTTYKVKRAGFRLDAFGLLSVALELA